MSWAKFDDLYDDGKKIKRAWRANRATVGLHAMAITYSARHELDGVIDIEWITDKLPAKGERDKALGALVDAGLFEIVDDAHFLVHDFLDYNPSRAQQNEKRARDAERKARGRDTQSAQRPTGVRADTTRTPRGVQAESGGPDPTRPDHTTPLTPQGGNQSAAASVGETAPVKPVGNRKTEHHEYDRALTGWAAQHFPVAHPSAVGGAVAEVRHRNRTEHVTATDVRQLAAVDEVWAGQLDLPHEPVLTDRQRTAIHDIGGRMQQLNDNATEAA